MIDQKEAIKKLNLDPNKKHLLFFGLIRDYKGLDLLLEAMPLLEKKDITLIIAGEYYANRSSYSSIIEKHQLTSRIIEINSFIPNNEVKYYFCAYDLVVQPYKSATQSGVTQIAYHFNKPMIVTNVGGLKEMCPDSKVGYVVEPNPQAVAKGINRFFKNVNIEDMTQNIIEEKKKYSWGKLSNEIYALTKKI